MEILREILSRTDPKLMPFLLIGGHAVNFYGISRQTGDLDLLVRLNDKTRWQDLLISFNYKIGQNDSNFARFRSDILTSWPLDLMFVNDETFSKLLAEAKIGTLGDSSVKIVSPRHLAILKIHALKKYQEHRFVKDYNDLVSLLKIPAVGISNDELRELCLKYATMELFNKLKNELKL